MIQNTEAKMMRLFLIGLIALALFFSGCSVGMTKAQRLEAFKADVLAENSPREHFAGHPDSGTVDYAMITTINLDSSVTFTSETISDIGFRLNLSGSAVDFVNGTWFNAGSGGLQGEDWYIYTMTDGFNTIP